MENLLFSLGQVVPFSLLIVLGQLFRRFGVLPETFFKGASSFVFRVALPANLFYSLCGIHQGPGIDKTVLLYITLSTLVSFFLSWGAGELLYRKRPEWIGAFTQGAFRGNYAILGLPLILAVAGEAVGATAALIVAVVIPMYSILSTIVLMARRGDGRENGSLAGVLLNIAVNPLIWGAVLGLVWGLLTLPLPPVLLKTVGYLSQCTTPMGLLSVGGIFEWRVARERIRPALWAGALKILVFPVLMTWAAYLLGLRELQLFLVFMTFVTPTSVSSYPMAVELGGDAPLAANVLILTTLGASFAIAAGIYLMRLWGWV